MRGLLGALFTGMVIAFPAQASDTESFRSLDITVSGAIRQHCAMGNIGNMDFGDLQRRGLSAQARVSLNCNVPFTMHVRGQNGALTHTAMPGGQGPYGGALPYSLAIEMPVRHPAVTMVSRSFGSQQLQAGGIISSNGGIATDDMTLAVELGTPSGEAGLLAGDYSETITITVTPT